MNILCRDNTYLSKATRGKKKSVFYYNEIEITMAKQKARGWELLTQSFLYLTCNRGLTFSITKIVIEITFFFSIDEISLFLQLRTITLNSNNKNQEIIVHVRLG